MCVNFVLQGELKYGTEIIFKKLLPFLFHFKDIRNSSSFVLCSENPGQFLVKRMTCFRTNAFYSFDQYLLGASGMPGIVQALVI